jgi:hypothetical protein
MYSPGRDSSEQLQALITRVAERRAALEQQREDLEATLQALDEVELNCREALARKTSRRTSPAGAKLELGEAR